ncbi:MAG: TIGR03936 family radical SAM-associated protein [Oscillospiraceae bacterium]|jgi:radical SAM-linked protein|nr:TIGR03936 family radical SAM-associated protein [Oscillospiraceae bacterium]
MGKGRLIFKKEGSAIYISHLDTMRTLTRVFLRAGIPLRHTEGFNPHPYISLALPLSVGHSSVCELMDFEITSELPPDALPNLLNPNMPSGLTAVRAYTPIRKIGEIKWLSICGALEYGGGAPDLSALSGYFAAKSIIIEKKTKRGAAPLDVIPLISKLEFTAVSDTAVSLHAVIAAQNPSLNPGSLVTALKTHRPELAPELAAFTRLALLDAELEIFE